MCEFGDDKTLFQCCIHKFLEEDPLQMSFNARQDSLPTLSPYAVQDLKWSMSPSPSS